MLNDLREAHNYHGDHEPEPTQTLWDISLGNPTAKPEMKSKSSGSKVGKQQIGAIARVPTDTYWIRNPENPVIYGIASLKAIRHIYKTTPADQSLLWIFD